MNGKEDSLAKKTSAIIFAVSLYWTVSISMVFVNKYLLSSTNLQFDAPLFITWFQCVVTVALCWLLAQFAKYQPGLIKFPAFSIDPKIAREILPLSVVFVGMITFNNLCLKYVSISFYMVVRSLTTVFNVILTYIFFGEKTSHKALGCCAIIITGFLMGIDQEKGLGSLSIAGVFFGISASLFVAMNAIYTKKSLNFVENNIWKLTMYNNVNACVIFIPFILLFGEHNEIFDFPLIFDSFFWFTMIIGGVLGFSMGYVTSLQIQATSPLTHNVSGTAKAYAQTLLGVFYFNEVKTFLWWISNGFVLLGAALYSHVRNQEMKERHRQSLEVPQKDSGINKVDKQDNHSIISENNPSEFKN
ncbi:GDP-fucose transporter 1-like [Brachionus plicatilis]|uniref:GDP-fucose transporter 1-like n=1 Tax=Brachionus plicatilis TaxID=10195 RepID=A0A3M7SUW8_BRAPC|nr:GDP-fucose transporter 1-like [Brachionus plicatilis]